MTKPAIDLDERTREELQPPCDMTWPRTTGKCEQPAELAVRAICLGGCRRRRTRLMCGPCFTRQWGRRVLCRLDGECDVEILGWEELR